MTEGFGALLRRLRMAREATIVREYYGRPHVETHTLSQNELGRRAGIDPAFISRSERDLLPQPPRRWVVERLADGLELGSGERAALLVAAGHWPWTDLEPETARVVLATALGVVAGDWHRVVPPNAHKMG